MVMRGRRREVPTRDSEVLVSGSPCEAGYRMSPPGAYRVDVVAHIDSVQAPRPPNGNLLVSRPRGSPDVSCPDIKGRFLLDER